MNEVQAKEMQKQIAKLFAQSISELAGDTPDVPTFAEFADRFIAEKMQSLEHRDSTKRATEYQVRRNLKPAFGPLRMNQIGNVDWNRWVREMRADQGRFKRVTRFFNSRKVLTEIFHAAKEAGLVSKVPRFDNPDEKRSVGRVLSKKEMWWLLRNTTYRLFRVFFYTLHKQGVRPREALKWERSMIRPNCPTTVHGERRA